MWIRPLSCLVPMFLSAAFDFAFDAQWTGHGVLSWQDEDVQTTPEQCAAKMQVVVEV